MTTKAQNRTSFLKGMFRKGYLLYLHRLRGLPRSLGEEVQFSREQLDHTRELGNESAKGATLVSIDDRTQVSFGLWPAGTSAAFNLNFDDLCPLYAPAESLDFGGLPGGGINEIMDRITDTFPELKITHFVIPNADPKFCGSRTTERGTLALNHPANRSWLAWVKKKVDAGQFEISMHGYSHYSSQVMIRRHAEFAFASKSTARSLLRNGLLTFAAVGLTPRGFRPPGWDVSSDLSLLDALKEFGFEYLAGSSIDAGLNYKIRRVSNLLPESFAGVLNIPQNIELDFTYDDICHALDTIVQNEGLISLKGHYTNIPLIPNSINLGSLTKLAKVLEYLRQRFKGRIWFASLRQIANRWSAISSIVVSRDPANADHVSITNNSPFRIDGLVVTILCGTSPRDRTTRQIVCNLPSSETVNLELGLNSAQLHAPW